MRSSNRHRSSNTADRLPSCMCPTLAPPAHRQGNRSSGSRLVGTDTGGTSFEIHYFYRGPLAVPGKRKNTKKSLGLDNAKQLGKPG